MKRLISMTILVLVALCTSIIFPLVAGADLSSVEITDRYSNYPLGSTRGMIYAQGVYWAFYNTYYKVSLDNGLTFGNETSLVAGNVTFDGGFHHGLSVATDASGTYVYLAGRCYYNGNDELGFRMGELHNDGSITWEDWQAVVVPGPWSWDMFPNVNVGIDGTGHYWIGYERYLGSTANVSQLYIIGSSTIDGTWTIDTDKTLLLKQVSNYCGGSVIPVGLSSTCAVIYSVNNDHVYARTWDSDTEEWGTEVVSESHCQSWTDGGGAVQALALLSAVAGEYDFIQIAYTKTSPYDIVYTWYDSPDNIMGWDSLIQSETTSETGPSISVSSATGNPYVWWIGTPLESHLYYKQRDLNLIWKAPVDLGIEGAGIEDAFRISAIDACGEDALAVMYKVSTDDLRFNRLYGNGTGSSPYGIALDATNITDTSATIEGLCTWSGGSGANATFVWQETGYAPVEIDMGSVATSEYFEAAISGLVPESLHWFYVKFENGGGNYSSNTIFFYTLASGGPSAPTVETLAADHVTSTSAWMQGYLAYDGELECFGGFDLRVQGAPTWIRSWYAFTNVWPFNTDRPLRSPTTFVVAVSNLAIDTTYEFRALAKNSLTEPAVVYGDILTFTTGHVTVATPTAGPGIELPPWLTFPFSISSTVKTILGIIITVVGMVFIVFVIRSTGGMLAAAAFGLGMTIIFTVIGWYPLWIILLIGAIVGLITFLVLLGRK